MDRAKTKAVVTILKDSALYETLPHEEKLSLLLRLQKDYPFLFQTGLHERNEDAETV